MRRMRVRAASSSAVQFCPAMKTSPAVGASSRPAICSSDDLPAPEGPTRATISPGSTVRLASTEDIEPPLALAVAARRHGAVRAPASAPAVRHSYLKRLDRIEPRGAPGGIERGDEGEHQRHEDDPRPSAPGPCRREAARDNRAPAEQIGAGEPLDRTAGCFRH